MIKNEEELALEIERKLSLYFGDYWDYLGAKKLMGRIFGLLIIQEKPISLSEISRKLQVTKSAVSTTINVGLQAQFFKKVTVAEQPRESFFIIEKDYLEWLIDPALNKLSLMIDYLNRGIKSIEKSDFELGQSERIDSIYNRLKFNREAMEIVLQEYEIFGEKIIDRIKELSKKYKAK